MGNGGLAVCPYSARLEARQQLERVLALDGALIGGCEAPVRDAAIDLRAIAEGIVGAVEHLRDRHHLEQRRDLSRRVALRQLVMEFPELGERTVGQGRQLALLGETDEAAGQERQRAAAMGEDPADVRKLHGGAAEHEVRDGARGIGRVFDRCRRDARNEAAAAIGRCRVDIDHGLAPIELLVDRGKRRIAEILVLVLVNRPMPSALSVSKAYSISLRLPCASGGAMTANRPKRPGWSRTILAPYSLSWRARPRASSTLFPYQIPGWTIERIAVAIPLLSISSSEAAGDHFGAGAARRPGAIMAST